MTLSIMTLGIRLNAIIQSVIMLSVAYSYCYADCHNLNVVMLNIIMLNVVMLCVFMRLYAECRYAACHIFLLLC
jgi:hypothetical protein